MREILGQLMMIGVSGTSLTEEEKKFIIKHNISGVTLFGRNVKEPKQIKELCEELQGLHLQISGKVPLYIAIDMEGGRVARLKAPFTQWPPLKKLGDLNSPTASYHFANAMGKELSEVGINLDFAPCADVFTNPKNTVIGDRAISSSAEIVSKHMSALIRGYKKAGIISCAKHFPGHGNTIVDSHQDLPVEMATLQRLESLELLPFKKVIKSKIQMIMTSHIQFKNIDPDWPVTLSDFFLKTLLREQLKYEGLVVTDDLDMKALASHYDRRMIPVRAIQAGADILLYCNEPESPPRALEAMETALVDGHLKEELIQSIYKRILDHKKENINLKNLNKTEDLGNHIGTPAHLNLAKAISEGKVPEWLAEESF